MAATPESAEDGADRLIAHWLQGNKDHAFICMDADGVVTRWLGAAEELFGHTAAEAVGRTLAHVFTSGDLRKGLHKYELDLAAMDSRSEDDRWHVRKDGTRIWMTGTVDALRSDDGELLGFVKVARDRTDLRGQIEAMENQAATLRESRERIHLFLRTLGHELRNPLGPLSTAAHIIRRLSDDAKIEGAVQIISRQVAALTRLADDLMDVTRLETGKVVLNLKPVDLRRPLSEAVQSLQETAAAKKLKLEAVLPEGSVEAEIDEDRFHRLVLNLLGNAIKYTPEGGSIWVKVDQEGSDVVFRVEDTGIGIAPEILPRIFELFTQDRAAVLMAPNGLGVGLAMVREIAELHHGTVQARSAGVGKGAEFTVRLPARGSRAASS